MAQFIERFDEHILFSLERRYLDLVNPERLELAMNPAADVFDYRAHLRMIHLDEISHEGDDRIGLHLLHMQNVLAAMKDDSHTLVSLVRGTEQGASLYYGLSRRFGSQAAISTNEYAQMLGAALHGNFLGARFTPLSADETWDQVIAPLADHGHTLAFPGIPSLRVREHDAPYVQGIDRFIEGMRGEDYCLVVIAEPIPLAVIDGMITNLFDLGSSVHAQIRSTIQNMKGSSDTVNLGMMGGSATTDASAHSFGGGLSAAPFGVGANAAYSFTKSFADMIGWGLTGGYARNWNRSTTVGTEELNKIADHCEKLTDAYIQRLQKGKNLGFWNAGIYLLTKKKYTQLRAKGLLRACFSGDTTYWEPVRSININTEALGQYLINFNNPLYNLFLYGRESRSVEQAVSFKQKLANYAANRGRSIAEMLGLIEKANPKERDRMLEAIRQSPGDYSKEALDQAWEQIREAQIGHPLGPALGGVSTPLNTEELSIIMNVPRQEVQGITIRSSTSFGTNYVIPQDTTAIRLGRVIHKRAPVDSMPYLLPRDLLQKHLFTCGVTGSGKTTTCMGLLRALGLPFMVIEPAKTEYRQMLEILPRLKIFTLGSEMISPFRINPFEFNPGSNLLTHIDNLKSVFSAAFPMYAAMPFILEEAIIEVYQEKGWELSTSTNIYLHGHSTIETNSESPENNERFFDFLPTLQDLYEKIDDVVTRKQYAQELTMNYSAALKARISSLLAGSKGLMLNTRRSTPMATLLTQPVVLELKYIGDDEEKCFLMGLLLSAIYEYRESYSRPGSPLEHVLLIEEAHRLLRRVPDFVSPEVGNTRGKAVETFSNVISEIRTLGQGMIVVDQIPSKLAQDVIKNTNMKIVHRTLAKDDRDYVGSTMNLTDEQSRELSLLGVGQAVLHREGMDKAFLVQIDRFHAGDLPFVDDRRIAATMAHFHAENLFVFQRYPGFEKHPDIPKVFTKIDFRTPDQNIYFAIMGAFVLMLMDDTRHLSKLRIGLHHLITRQTRKDQKLERACYVIHYATKLFYELNAKYPGCYDRCLAMNQCFIDLWFEGMEGFISPPEGARNQTTQQAMTAKLQEHMRYLRRDHHLSFPFFAYYMNRIDADTSRRLRDNWRDTEQDMDNLSIYLRQVIRTLLSGVVPSKVTEQTLSEELLTVIFWADPRRPTILRNYQQRNQ